MVKPAVVAEREEPPWCGERPTPLPACAPERPRRRRSTQWRWDRRDGFVKSTNPFVELAYGRRGARADAGPSQSQPLGPISFG